MASGPQTIDQTDDRELEVEPVADVTLYQGFVAIVLYRVARPVMRSADAPPIVVEGPTPTAVLAV
jgi:hypothetical protein